MKLNLARDVKNNDNGFYRYMNQKRQATERIPPRINEKGEQVTTDMEKAEVLHEFFASIVAGSQDSQISYISEPLGRKWGSKLPPTVRAEQIRDCLTRLSVNKSIGPDAMYSRGLRLLAG